MNVSLPIDGSYSCLRVKLKILCVLIHGYFLPSVFNFLFTYSFLFCFGVITLCNSS